MNNKIFSVKALVGAIRKNLEGDFHHVRVQGEIVALTRAASGHLYFTLKDAGAQIRAMMFKTNARFLKFTPEDGMEVVVRGRVGVYEPRGEMQLVADAIDPVGYGALALAFENLKKELAQKGYFDLEAKKAIPEFPSCVGIVTSLSAAALYDALRVLFARQPGLHVIVSPAPVQGETAPPMIATAVSDIDALGVCDVILVVRGGGSPEDLWAFNDPRVVQAVFQCNTPTISGVGHEIDVTLCDLAADLRAATPTAAAQAATEDYGRLADSLIAGQERLRRSAERHIHTLQQDLDVLTDDLERNTQNHTRVLQRELANYGDRLMRTQPLHRIAQKKETLKENRKQLSQNILRRLKAEAEMLKTAADRLPRSIKQNVEGHRSGYEMHFRQLKNLSPLGVLKRGYAIARDPDTGKIARRAADHPPDSRLEVLLGQGALDVRVSIIK